MTPGRDARFRVLLVDDDPKLLLSLDAVLSGEFDVQTSTSPARALDLIRGGPFDVVCSDHQMPEMTGLEFLRHVQAVDPIVSCVMLTADRALFQAPPQEGSGYGILLKPCDPGTVVREVRSLGQLARLRRSVSHLTSKLGRGRGGQGA